MRIGELKPKQNIALLVNANGTLLTFESVIQEVAPLKNLIFAEAVMSNDKPVSFRGKNIMVSLLVYFDEEKPILFKNVSTKLFKRSGGDYCYGIATIAEGHVYNRRENFRCHIGLESSIQCGSNTAASRTAFSAASRFSSLDRLQYICTAATVTFFIISSRPVID